MTMFPKSPFRRRNKYNADLTAGGSKLERAVDALLELRAKAGDIRELKRQQIIVLQDGPREERITWRIDFSFVLTSSNELSYAEAKGVETEVYKLKLKLFRAQRPARLEIWKGNYRNPILVEVIEANERQLAA